MHKSYERFYSKIKKKPRTGCWEWQACTDPAGYGQFYYKGKVLPAHKVSYMIHKEEVEKGLVLLHSCDNRRCCNPDHLTPGTQAENLADMVAKGRSCRGSKHHASKMTAAKVRNLREKYNKGIKNRTELARYYGIGYTAVVKITNKETWKHI
jgi:hypothetical protein